ncbi:MAG: inverse autotransporter beta domain-containing protein [Planctomycetes bacterium]|nr:inverse autotransporter beta domain-containing protein [Planctomycetota bacterium]
MLQGQPFWPIRWIVAGLFVLGAAQFAHAQQWIDPATNPIAPYSAAGVAPLPGYDSYLHAEYFVGDGLGYSDPYTTVGAFVPIGTANFNSLRFVDAQVFATNENYWGTNIGIGQRWFDPSSDRTWGASLWYDLDDDAARTVQQLGVGLESLGTYWDLRASVNVPLTNDPKQQAVIGDATFSGTSIIIDRTLFRQTPLSKAEVEFGGKLYSDRLRGYVGCYYLDGENGADATGAMARVEGFTIPEVGFQLTLRSDSIFKTSVLFGMSFTLPGGSPARGSQSYYTSERLAQRVRRSYRVSRHHEVIDAPYIATDTTSGTPITVAHLSNAIIAGDGSVSTPFNTLAGAAASGRDIIFGHGGSTLTGQSITLQDNQRMLGEGLSHTINDSIAGPIALPTATTSTVTPIITGAPTDAITLANNNEVTGWSIQSTTGNGIAAIGITDFSIGQNTINLSTGNAFRLENVSGNGTLSQNTITNNGSTLPSLASGGFVSTNGTGTLNVLVDQNIFTGNGQIPITTLTVGTFNAGHGLELISQGTATMNLQVSNNSWSDNAAPPIGAALSNNTGGLVTINSGDALRITANDSSLITGLIDTNSIGGNGCYVGGITNTSGQVVATGGNAIAITANSAAATSLTISNNTIGDNGFFGSVTNAGTSLNAIGGSGISLVSAPGSTALIGASLTGNTILNNGQVLNSTNANVVAGHGIDIRSGSSSLDLINITNNSIGPNGFITTSVGGTTTVGFDISAQTSLASSAVFAVIGNNLVERTQLDNTAGGTFQVQDLPLLNINNTGTFSLLPTVGSFTNVPGP